MIVFIVIKNKNFRHIWLCHLSVVGMRERETENLYKDSRPIPMSGTEAGTIPQSKGKSPSPPSRTMLQSTINSDSISSVIE